MKYVYILKSLAHPDSYYIGSTSDLKRRLQEHNRSDCPTTKFLGPWDIKTYLAFTNEEKANKFEKYLKSSTGRRFAKRKL